MKSGFEIDFSELENYIHNMQSLKKDFNAFLEHFLIDMAERVIAQTKRKTPVDTGALRASWSIATDKQTVRTSRRKHKNENSSNYGKTSKVQIYEQEGNIQFEGEGKNLTLYIVNPQEYASEVEYGHRILSGTGPDKVEVGWKDGYFMLTTSIDYVQRQMPARFKREFQEFCAKHGIKN